MSHNRYMSWPDALTMAPAYPPSGAGTEYPSPAASRRASECFSDMSGSRRGSLAGFASEMESTGQWQSIGSESKSPLAQFGFFKSLTEKKTTRGQSSRCQLLYDTHASTDGQPAKRRGPKPDSKPALTRRQELNRQAQRYSMLSTATQIVLTSSEGRIEKGRRCISKRWNKKFFA